MKWCRISSFRNIVFQGENDIEQLCCVLRVLGTPNEKIWPGMSLLPDYNKITFPENPPIPLEKIVPDASIDAVDLLKKFLVYPSEEVSSFVYLKLSYCVMCIR